MTQQTIKQPASRRSIIAFSLSLLGFVVPLLIQYLVTVNYDIANGSGGEAGWAISVFFYAVLTWGFIGLPLGITSLVLGILSLRKKASAPKGLAVAAIVVAGIDIIFLPILCFVASGIAGQSS
ncbi:MAG: hypothetical protein JWN26_347 [Candidatus Saccharibacteria bacterium]|nr:hypothetical protein [Candidatus Saccharibacteria bacterium]